jgi:RNA polymerase sigma factor (sigma-70 family)
MVADIGVGVGDAVRRAWRSRREPVHDVPGRPGAEVASDDTDAELLALVARGDSSALTRLYEAHASRLFGYLLRLAGDRMTAEEILQDTMLAVWRSAASYTGGSRVTTWLFGVARRQAYNRLRTTPPPVAAEPVDVADRAPGPEELAVAAAGGTPAAVPIGRLPNHHREVIGLVFVAGLPLADVAEILGIPVGTVKSRLHHARATLVQLLASQGVPE